MSTDDAIKRLCSSERLSLFAPDPVPDAFEGIPRRIYLTREIAVALERGIVREESRWWEVCADLMPFVERRPVTVRRLGYDHDADMPAFFVRLDQRHEDDPPEVWEVRFTTARPQIRMFGSFIARDEFVAVTWDDRRSVDYPTAMRDCAAAWVELFDLDVFPLKGAFPNAYLSRTQLVPP